MLASSRYAVLIQISTAYLERAYAFGDGKQPERPAHQQRDADRLTTDHDPQIGRVKDMGSAAVGVSLLMSGAFWLFALAERMGAI